MKMPKESCRKEELARLQARYASRGKAGKTRLLDEFCEHYGYERKHAIKLLGDALPKATGQVRFGPEPVYEPVREVVERIWRASEQLCGKRLAPALELWLPHYGKHFGRLLPTQKKLLKKVSAATLDRLLAPIKSEVPRRLCGTRPGTLLRTQIPIAGEVWDEKRAGFLEADSVAHCGASLAGDFIWSLTYTCLGSGWTEGRAVWNKGAAGVVEQTRDVEMNLPFALLGLDFDNGSEWLNWHLVRYLQERSAPVKLTRSRPYHKDDNAHVEQKNWMWRGRSWATNGWRKAKRCRSSTGSTKRHGGRCTTFSCPRPSWWKSIGKGASGYGGTIDRRRRISGSCTAGNWRARRRGGCGTCTRRWIHLNWRGKPSDSSSRSWDDAGARNSWPLLLRSSRGQAPS
jgi:hypothetical protein